MICGVPRTELGSMAEMVGGQIQLSKSCQKQSCQEWAVGVTLKENGLPDTTDDPEES